MGFSFSFDVDAPREIIVGRRDSIRVIVDNREVISPLFPTEERHCLDEKNLQGRRFIVEFEGTVDGQVVRESTELCVRFGVEKALEVAEFTVRPQQVGSITFNIRVWPRRDKASLKRFGPSRIDSIAPEEAEQPPDNGGNGDNGDEEKPGGFESLVRIASEHPIGTGVVIIAGGFTADRLIERNR